MNAANSHRSGRAGTVIGLTVAMVVGWLGLVASPAAAVTTWQPAVTLTPEAESAGRAQSVVSDDGQSITVAWSEYAGGYTAVKTRSSSDGGSTWGGTKTLSAPDADSSQPKLVASADGQRVTAVWQQVDAPPARTVYVASTTNGGATWSTRQALTTGSDFYYETTAAASSSGTTITVAWTNSDLDTGLGVVESRTSTDGGSTWAAAKSVSSDEALNHNPALTSSANGSKLALVWQTAPDGDPMYVTASHSTDGGATWSTPKAISATGIRTGSPEISGSADGQTLLAVWPMNPDPNENYSTIQSARSTDGGASWKATYDLGIGAPVYWQKVALSSDGQRQAVIWQSRKDSSPWSVHLRTSADGGSSWSADKALSPDDKNAVNPSLSSSSDGKRLTVAWVNSQPNAAPTGTQSKGAPAEPSIVTATSTTDGGTSWEANTELSDSTKISGYPEVVSSADGSRMVATWEASAIPKGARKSLPTAVEVTIGTSPLPPTPPTPPADKKNQKPADSRGKAPKRIKTKGMTVITGKGARTNAGQLIRTRVRCLHGPAAAGETRYCTVLRGPKNKVVLRTYGQKVRVVVVQFAPATAQYKAYRKRTVYIDGVKR